MINSLKLKIDSITNSKIRQLPKVKSLTDLSKSLQKKESLIKEFSKEVNRAINDYYGNNEIPVSEKTQLDSHVRNSVNKIMAG